MGEIAGRDEEHWRKLEAAQKRVTDQLWALAAPFGKGSEEELLVMQVEAEDWDLVRRMNLASDLEFKLRKRQLKP